VRVVNRFIGNLKIRKIRKIVPGGDSIAFGVLSVDLFRKSKFFKNGLERIELKKF